MRIRLLSLLLILLASSAPGWAQTQCQKAYAFSPTENIESAGLEEVVRLNGANYEGLFFNGDLITRKIFKDWPDVQAFYKPWPQTERKILTRLLESRKGALVEFQQNLEGLAQRNNGTLTYRIKDLQSLKRKIFRRIESAEEVGKSYFLSNLADIVGFRIVVPPHSLLLKLTDVQTWTQILQLRQGQILEIEVKGTPTEIELGRYYSATHLNLKSVTGEIFELQVINVPMSIWHKWDHRNVYKNVASNPETRRALIHYSQSWGWILNVLWNSAEPISFEKKWLQVRTQYNLKADSTLMDLNRSILSQSGLSPEMGFTEKDLQEIQGVFSNSVRN